MKIKYTIIERWMASLGIKGASQIIFAVIFGYVKSTQSPIDITYDELSNFTGYSRTCVSGALKDLKTKGLICMLGESGKKGRYNVVFKNLPCEAINISKEYNPPQHAGTSSETGYYQPRKGTGTSSETGFYHPRKRTGTSSETGRYNLIKKI